MKLISDVKTERPITIEFTEDEANFLYALVGAVSDATGSGYAIQLFDLLKTFYKFSTYSNRYQATLSTITSK